MWKQKLDLMIFVDPFQLGVCYDKNGKKKKYQREADKFDHFCVLDPAAYLARKSTLAVFTFRVL